MSLEDREKKRKSNGIIAAIAGTEPSAEEKKASQIRIKAIEYKNHIT